MAEQVKAVIDGDTLLLEDGRFVRLIGIDAPETAHKDHDPEPLADEARDLLEARVVASSWSVRLAPGLVGKDRYGRTLAYVFDGSGRHLNQLMLESGLATLMVFPPNTRFIEGFQNAQRQARLERQGLWGDVLSAPVSPAALESIPTRVKWVRGQITSVHHGRNAVFVGLAGGLTLKSTREEWSSLGAMTKDWKKGRWVSVLGKSYLVKRQPRIRLRHAAQLMN